MRKIISIIVSIFIITFLCLFIFLPKSKFSENENRYLKSSPVLNFKNFFNRRFQDDLSVYFSDHFPFREKFLSFKSRVDYRLGITRINDVYYGVDNSLLEEYKKPKNSERIVNIVNKFYENNNVDIDFMLVPTSIYVNRFKIDIDNLSYDEMDTIKYFKENLDVNFIDVSNTLVKHNSEYIYYNSDYHWTSLGSYYAYLEYCKNKGIDCNKKVKFETVSRDFYGTLYSKILDNSIQMDYLEKDKSNGNYDIEIDGKKGSLYDESYLKKKDKYSYFLGGNHGIITIKNKTIDNCKTILVIKDSYANCFIPFLIKNYSNVIVIDPRYYNKSISTLIEDNDVNNILFLYNVITIDDDLRILSINR